VQAQSLLAGQPALLRLEDMAAHYIQEIRKVQPHGPYRLLGYSFGGTVALEMAHQLRAAGEIVAPIGMLDARSLHYDQAFQRELSTQSRVSRRLTRFQGNTTSLSWRDRLTYIAEKLCTRAVRNCAGVAHSLGLRTQGVDIHDIPGDHERMFLEPSIDILAAELQAAIQRA
jgi:pimeloyl-ACP methyl ester carboxylesterase